MGEPPAKRRMAEVAARAGVSPMTVSRALRTPEKVTAATREKVQAAAAALDYVPDLIAGGLAARRSRLVAVVVSTLEGSIFAATVGGLEAVLREAGYAVLLGSSGYSQSSEEDLLRAVLGRRPDGVVLTASVHTGAARRLLRGAGVPVVEAWELPESPLDLAVGFSNRAAGAAMTEALHAWGYRRIAFIGAAASGDERASLRREGYRDAIHSLGTGPPREVLLPGPVVRVTDGERALSTLLALHPDADAAFCVVDGLAAGLLLACRRRGIEVPGHLAVAGFGGFELAEPEALDISTIAVPGHEIGRRAGALLLARLAGERLAEPSIDVGFSVVRRGSA